MWIHWVSTYFVDPENWIGQMYDSQFHGTWKASAWYKNAKVDELLRKARVTVAQAERQPLYEEATRMIVADARTSGSTTPCRSAASPSACRATTSRPSAPAASCAGCQLAE